MSDLIKLYHGTLDLEGVVRKSAIMSPRRQNGENFWLIEKRKYDALTKKFADVARAYVNGGNLIAGFGDDQELLRNDEALADMIQETDIHVVDVGERIEYKDLKRHLYIYFADEYAGARCHAYRRTAGQIGALLEVEVPTNRLRPSFLRYKYGKRCSLFEVPKEVPLQYLQQAFVSKEDFARAVQLLGEHNLREVKVSEFR